jgi:phosphoethanolamine N-methyltransferase
MAGVRVEIGMAHDDAGEYDADLVALLELVWGDGFLSPGGPGEVARILEGVSLGGLRVLDIGCGIGGVDLLLAREHGAAEVLGIDIETRLVAHAAAKATAAGLGTRVRFQAVTPGALPFEPASFDVVFSKDAMTQIPDKSALFAEVFRVLRPGGLILASDWLKGKDGPPSAAMLEFFRLEGLTYNMATARTMRAALETAGFARVELADRNAWYAGEARAEWEAMQGPLKARMIALLGEAKHAHFVANWAAMVAVLDAGELRPTHMRARKRA